MQTPIELSTEIIKFVSVENYDEADYSIHKFEMNIRDCGLWVPKHQWTELTALDGSTIHVGTLVKDVLVPISDIISVTYDTITAGLPDRGKNSYSYHYKFLHAQLRHDCAFGGPDTTHHTLSLPFSQVIA